jgi:predicted PurR-regulated permease PerM
VTPPSDSDDGTSEVLDPATDSRPAPTAPAVYGRALKVNPMVTIVSVLAGAALLGILGALLAIPTAAAIQIVLRDWWVHRTQAAPATATTADS